MHSSNKILPCDAYIGDEPFVFVSYAHKDAARVYPEIKRLHDDGYRVWYDEGIRSGRDFATEIASAIMRCSRFIVFITPTSVKSRYVRNEIKFALKREIEFLAVHLEATELPLDLELEMSTIQAILRHEVAEATYRKWLYSTMPAALTVTPLGPNSKDDEPPSVPSGESHSVVVSVVEPASLSLVPLASPQSVPTSRQSGAQASGTDPYGEYREIAVQSVPFRFRWIPPGQFMMGSPLTEYGRFSVEEQQPVTITRGFWMGETSVTQAQWQAVMPGNPSMFKGLTRPVEMVSWHDCMEFCHRLNAIHPKVYARLPSEAEWEYACRAGTVTAFNDGSDCTELYGRDAALENLGWYWKNSGFETQPVKQKAPNTWGLYDMHGNVREWCLDISNSTQTLEVEDPMVTGCSADPRMARGGSWNYYASYCRSACRRWSDPNIRNGRLGLRIIMGQVPETDWQKESVHGNA